MVGGSYGSNNIGGTRSPNLVGAVRVDQALGPVPGVGFPDFNIGQVGVITRWTPVKNLTFSADLVWSHLDQKYSGTVGVSPSGVIAKPTAVYELKGEDTVVLLLRAQRNW